MYSLRCWPAGKDAEVLAAALLLVVCDGFKAPWFAGDLWAEEGALSSSSSDDEEYPANGMAFFNIPFGFLLVFSSAMILW